MAHLKRLRVLCSSIRVLLPVRSSSCRVAGSESDSGISFSSLQLKSTSYKQEWKWGWWVIVKINKVRKKLVKEVIAKSDLYFRQVEDLWEDSDMIRVCYQRVQSLAAGHSGWYRL